MLLIFGVFKLLKENVGMIDVSKEKNVKELDIFYRENFFVLKYINV